MLITLTTDFGIRDPNAAALKGALLRLGIPGLQLVDVTHEIAPFDIVQAAYVLRNAWEAFPAETIHVLLINTRYEQDPNMIILKRAGQWFIAPDNGLLALLFEEPEGEVWSKSWDSVSEERFQLRTLLSQIVQHIHAGLPMDELAEKANGYTERLTLRPVISQHQIRCSVAYIDQYDNVVLNLTQPMFDRASKGRKFSLFFKNSDPLTEVSKHYSDVSIGEVLCRFNSASHLELAINLGSAASMLGLELDDTIQIDFQDPE